HGLLGCLQKKVVAPALGISPNRTRPKKRRRCNVQPGALHNLCNRPDVVFMRPSRTVGTDFHFVIDDFSGQAFHMLSRTLPRPRPSREPDATTAAVHCSRSHGSFRRAVRGRRKFPLCSSVPSVVTHQHRGHRGIPSGRTGLAPITSSSAQPSAQKPKSAPAPP